MARDLGIHTTTGDLLFASNMDFQVVEAEEVIRQRIFIRIMVERGMWIYDRSGTLGSDTRRSVHLPRTRAVHETELFIRHALEPMRDISVTSVEIEESGDDPQQLIAHISYTMTDVSADDLGLVSTMPESIEIPLDL